VITVSAPAKVNLHLAVGSVRTDGYHDLTGVFHTLELADTVRIVPASSLTLDCDSDLGVAAEDNLAYLAAVRFADAVGRMPNVAISLLKSIPHGAGLGGGSSDAAAVIAGLALLWGVDAADPRRIAAAQSLGADVPFFLTPGGAALMVGRGDVVARALPALAGVPVAIVRPQQPVPTSAAYAAFDAEPIIGASPDAVVAALESSDVGALALALSNNLENASSAVVPAVAEAIAWMRTQPGVRGAAVAGSGSAVFAIVTSDEHAQQIRSAAEARGWWGASTRLAGHGVSADAT